MILFEGHYSGVLVPDRHFIVLKKDFSNFYDLIAKLKDHQFLQDLADRTYNEVALDPRWSYRAFIEKVDDSIEFEVMNRSTVKAINPYSRDQFDRGVFLSFNYFLRRKFALLMQSLLLGFPLARKSLFWLWEVLPRPLKRIARPLARVVSR